MKRLMLLTAVVAFACQPTGSTATPDDAAPVVTDPKVDPDRIRATLTAFADDAMRGRYTLRREDIDKAADFLAAAYVQAGIAPVGSDYRVDYQVPSGSKVSSKLNVWLEVDREPHEVGADDVVSIANGEGNPAVGSVVVIPPDGKHAKKAAGKVAVVFGARTEPAKVAALVATLREAGAAGAVLVASDGATMPDAKALEAAVGDASMPAVLVRARAVLGITLDGKPLSSLAGSDDAVDAPKLLVSLAAGREDVTTDAPNVLAYLPGTDLADEIVVVGAHFDHIGTTDRGHFCRERTLEDGAIDGVCNGADDNGSGTVGDLEIARALKTAGIKPRRSIVFAHFSGEELGLYGSKALAERPPDAAPFSGGRVVAMVNMDMIGRYGAAGLSIGAVSSSDAWMPILESAGDHGLEITYERAVTSRSDHANYYKKQVPVLFFFTGLHDDYHGPGDEVDEINFDAMAEIVTLAMDVTLAAADGRDMSFAEPRSGKEGITNRMPGSDPDTVEKKVEASPSE